jgi:Right handed beta helix region
MKLRTPSLHGCVSRGASATAFAVLSMSLTGCGAPADEALGEVSQGIDIAVAPGSSIVSAINQASPGDRILVRAGTYNGGGWIERSGTAAAPITVVSVDGPRAAVIQGGGEALRIGASAYLVFDGFEVRNSTDNAVHIDNSHHITLRNLYAHDAGPDGDVLKVNQSNNIVVERSEFARPGPRLSGVNPYQECLDFVDVDDSAIRDNFIHDGGSMLAFVKGGSRNTIIERNVFSQQRAGASDPMVGIGGPTDLALLQGEQYEIINVIFRNNVVVGGLIGAVAVYDAQGAFIANNLFVNNDRALIEFRAGNGPAAQSQNVQVVDNVAVDTRGQMPTPFLLSSHGLTGLATSYNLYWNNGAALPTTTLLTLASQVGHLSANPLVGVPAATAGRDAILAAVRPGAGSVATGTGADTTVSPFGVTVDVNLVSRGTARDRGPFMLGASTVASAPPDAGVVADSGVVVDSGVVADAGVVADSGVTTGTKVTSVSFMTSSAGSVGHATVISARSTGSVAPRYRFAVRNPAGTWTLPCGGYTAATTCSFTPAVAGTWTLRVWARDSRSTATFEATSGDVAYAVAAAPTTSCPPTEPVYISARGNPIGTLSGHIRWCFPGELLCYCDADHDCYAEPGYAPCR